MLNWINFLHFYQPANSESYKIEEALNKSYKWIIRTLEKNRQAKLTVNISGCLLVRLSEMGYDSFIERVKKLAERQQIELVASAAYHGLLPLLPDSEIRRQIEYSKIIIEKFFGKNIKVSGFYFPEMAYGRKAAKIVKEAGYEWIILDDFALRGKSAGTGENIDKLYTEENGLKVIFRSRRLSRTYPPQAVLSLLDGNSVSDKTAITGTDAEIYGLRHIDTENHFETALDEPKISTMTVSEFIEIRPASARQEIFESTWDSEEAEIKKGLPYSIWQDPANELQAKIWELASFALKQIDRNTEDENFAAAYKHLAMGIASCTFWWASNNDFRKVFGPVAWNPDEIEKNTSEIIRSIRSLSKDISREDKIKAEKMYSDIQFLLWKKHWEKE